MLTTSTPPATPRLAWKENAIAIGAVIAIILHLVLRFGLHASPDACHAPLMVALVIGGLPLLLNILVELWHRDLGADVIAGISIVAAAWLGEYLAGTFVVLMLAGGVALEHYAVQSASSVLRALAKRMPSVAHRKQGAEIIDVTLDDLAIGDVLVVFPHEVCPVDGVVLEGHSVMDESFLTGEPFRMSKAPGAAVLSGAMNGDLALTMQATKLPIDSRYAKITEVMRAAEQNRPRLRRLADQLGAWYVPLSLAVAIGAWLLSGQARRFFAGLVVATPCPLLIAIPVAIIGAIELAARRSIIIKNPAVLEQIDTCRTAIFDKTGTLTYGEPRLAEILCAPGCAREEVLALAASVERYSRHPLAKPVLTAAQEAHIVLHEVSELREVPGQGLHGVVLGRNVRLTSRQQLVSLHVAGAEQMPTTKGGLECVVVIDQRYAATLWFRDEPKAEGQLFIQHLGPKHQLHRVLIVSGDRESEVRYLAERVGITEVFAEQSPEQKLAIVTRETQRAKTLVVGDGINDAPALMAATVGVAIGQNSDITGEAAGVVIMDNSLEKIDEFMHISRHLRAIALQSAVGGMILSLGGMLLAAAGYLPPVAGAIAQEIIDLLAVLNALRVAISPRELSDFSVS